MKKLHNLYFLVKNTKHENSVLGVKVLKIIKMVTKIIFLGSYISEAKHMI